MSIYKACNRTESEAYQKQLRQGSKDGWTYNGRIEIQRSVSVIFSTVYNWYIFSNLFIRLAVMVSFVISRGAKFAKVKIKMMTKDRSYGSSVTHVKFGTTKLVL